MNSNSLTQSNPDCVRRYVEPVETIKPFARQTTQINEFVRFVAKKRGDLDFSGE